MTLTVAIAEARRRHATRENREAQKRAELRLEEQIKVAGIADAYDVVDRAHDAEIRRAFATVYHLVDSDEEKAAVSNAFAVWMRHDGRKDRVTRESVGETGRFMRRNNPVWIDGAAVPPNSDGAA